MNQNGETPKQTITSVWAIIEKIHELRWTLHLAMVVLFADLVLVWRSGRGIIHWSTSTDQLLANAGLLITGALAFGVLMSLMMPLFGWVVRWLLLELIWQITKEINIDNPHDRGQVSPNELHDYALRKGDKLLLDIYEAHEQKKWARISDKLAYGQMVFSVLVLAALDFYLADWFGIQGTTVLRALALLGELGQRALLIVVLLLVLLLWWAWFTEDGPDGIDYPPLYEEIEEQQKQQRKLHEKIEEQRNWRT